MYFFEEGLSDFLPDKYCKLNCLGLLKGSFCPHYPPKNNRGTLFKKLINTKKIKPGIGIEDGTALYFENGVLKEIVDLKNYSI